MQRRRGLECSARPSACVRGAPFRLAPSAAFSAVLWLLCILPRGTRVLFGTTPGEGAVAGVGMGSGVRLNAGVRVPCPESRVLCPESVKVVDVGEGGRLGIGDSGGIAPLRGGAEDAQGTPTQSHIAEAPGKSDLRELVRSRGLRADKMSTGELVKSPGDGVQATGAGWEGREGEPAGSRVAK